MAASAYVKLFVIDAAFDDYNSKIERDDILQSDYPLTLDEVLSVYIIQSLALKILAIKYLQERIVFEVLIRNKLCKFISLYQSPSQPTDLISLRII